MKIRALIVALSLATIVAAGFRPSAEGQAKQGRDEVQAVVGEFLDTLQVRVSWG